MPNPKKILDKALRVAKFIFSPRKKPVVSPPKFTTHANRLSYLSSEFNKPGIRILELGSRAVIGPVCRNSFPDAEYIGFDYYEGPNVDLTGDAHKLSSYFSENEKFDLIFSIAVFEHFFMPWVVASEIQKLLKVGGSVYVETHFSYSSHERPWNFFQFSDLGLRVLFNSALGFELLDSGMSNPIRGYFTSDADDYLQYDTVTELYCHSSILCRKKEDVTNFSWATAAMDELVGDLRYPTKPRGRKGRRKG